MLGDADILAMVMAGGKGERLFPLTVERTKPSVPFGGKYRIIDFALSNLINSQVYAIYVLVQYKSQSLIEHIRTSWSHQGIIPHHFITVVPPQMRKSKVWYRGTADSIYQNINLIYDLCPSLVAIFAGDHIYRMNIKEMIDYHLRKKAKLTIAVIPISAKEVSQFGVVEIKDGFQVKSFKEKIQPFTKRMVYASMGNYIFDTDFLIEALNKDAQKEKSTHDFGRDILPELVKRCSSIYAYDFSKNRIPGLKRYEARYYWKDVGTIFSYYNANMDLLGKSPKLDLANPSWPIYASNFNLPPSHIVGSHIENSFICEGTRIYKARIINSIIGRGVNIEQGSVIEDSLILDFCKIKNNVYIKRAIVDRFNTINSEARIGYSTDDRKNYYLDPSGIVVLKRGPRKAFHF